jgi:hypothetical protein
MLFDKSYWETVTGQKGSGAETSQTASDDNNWQLFLRFNLSCQGF